MSNSATAAPRRFIALRTATALAVAVAALSGCGAWFGEDEKILPGERVTLRRVAPDARAAEKGAAELPPAKTVSAWPQAGGSSNRSVGHIGGALALERVWSTSIGAGSDSESRIVAPPVAGGGKVFAMDAAAQITAVAIGDGARLWEADVTPEDEDGRDGFGGGLALAGDTLVATTGFGEVIGLNVANGERRWTMKVGAPFRSPPTISNGLAVVVSRDGRVIAVSLKDGKEVWSAVGLEGGAAMMGGGGSSVAISGEIVAAPFASGDIGVFRLRDGRRGWAEPLGAARRGSAMALIADVTSPPVIAGGRVIAGGVSGRLVSFDIPTGRRLWGRDLGAYNPVWAAGSTVFVITEDSRAMALDAGTGKTIWSTPLPRYDDPEDKLEPFAYGGPILVGGKLIMVSTDEKIFRLDATTGKAETVVDLPDGSAVPPIFVNDRLIVLDDGGDLHAYR